MELRPPDRPCPQQERRGSHGDGRAVLGPPTSGSWWQMERPEKAARVRRSQREAQGPAGAGGSPQHTSAARTHAPGPWSPEPCASHLSSSQGTTGPGQAQSQGPLPREGQTCSRLSFPS